MSNYNSVNKICNKKHSRIFKTKHKSNFKVTYLKLYIDVEDQGEGRSVNSN